MKGIADFAGYESEAAFSRAFKRHFGMPPADWRRRQMQGEGAGRDVAGYSPRRAL